MDGWIKELLFFDVEWRQTFSLIISFIKRLLHYVGFISGKVISQFRISTYSGPAYRLTSGKEQDNEIIVYNIYI